MRGGERKRVTAKKAGGEDTKKDCIIDDQQTVMTNRIRSDTRMNQRVHPQWNYNAKSKDGPKGVDALKACVDDYMKRKESIEKEDKRYKYTLAELEQQQEDGILPPAEAKRLAREEKQRHQSVRSRLTNGSSIRDMAEKWGVPKSTLGRHTKDRREGKTTKAGSGASYKWPDYEAYQLYKHLRTVITLHGSISVPEFQRLALATWKVFREREKGQAYDGDDEDDEAANVEDDEAADVEDDEAADAEDAEDAEDDMKQPKTKTFSASMNWVKNFCRNFGFKRVGASKHKKIGFHRRTAVTHRVVNSFAALDHAEKQKWLVDVCEHFDFKTVLHMMEHTFANKVVESAVLTSDETVVGNRSPATETQIQQEDAKIPQITGSQSSIIATVNEVYSCGLGQFYTEVFSKKPLDETKRTEMKRLFGVTMKPEDEVTDEYGSLRDDAMDEEEEDYITFHVVESGSYNGQSHGDMVAKLRAIWKLRWGDAEINGKKVADMPLLLTTDGPPSHSTEYVVESARKAGIKIIILPSYSSWWLQVADDRPFCHIKQEYYQKLKIRRTEEMRKPPNLSEMLLLFFQARRKRLSAKIIQSAYRDTGQWPPSPIQMKNKAERARKKISGESSWEDQDDVAAKDLENLIRRLNRLVQRLLSQSQRLKDRGELQQRLYNALDEAEQAKKEAVAAKIVAEEAGLAKRHYTSVKKNLANIAGANERFKANVLLKFNLEKMLIEREEIEQACMDQQLNVDDVSYILTEMIELGKVVTQRADQNKSRNKQEGYVLAKKSEAEELKKVMKPAINNWKAVKKEMVAIKDQQEEAEKEWNKIKKNANDIAEQHGQIYFKLADLKEEKVWRSFKTIYTAITKASEKADKARKDLHMLVDKANVVEGYELQQQADIQWEALQQTAKQAATVFNKRAKERAAAEKKKQQASQKTKGKKRQKVKDVKLAGKGKKTVRKNAKDTRRRRRDQKQSASKPQAVVDDEQPEKINSLCIHCGERFARNKPERLSKRFTANYCPAFCHTVCTKPRCSRQYEKLQQYQCGPQ